MIIDVLWYLHRVVLKQGGGGVAVNANTLPFFYLDFEKCVDSGKWVVRRGDKQSATQPQPDFNNNPYTEQAFGSATTVL
jgi:hypothetical protein